MLAEAGFIVQTDPRDRPPDLVLVLLTHATDAERVGELRAVAGLHPEARVLAVMPAGAPNASLRRVLLAGASGIVLDDDLERTFVPTARAVLAGQLTVPTALGRQIAPRPLSHREKQILALVMLGRTNREIADALYLAESTIKTHLSSAFRKLDARSRSEAVTRITDPESVYGPSILELANGPLAAAG
jgi:DNA-binding NarL/FixJ family response regulator